MWFRHRHSISDVVQTSTQNDKWCGSDTSTTRQVMWFRHQHSMTSDVFQISVHDNWCGSDTSTREVMWFRHQYNKTSDVVSSFCSLKILKMLLKILNFSTLVSPVMGDKYMYLTYYVHLVAIKQVTDCKNARSGNLQIVYTETQSDSQTPDKIFTIPAHVRKQASGWFSNII